MPESTTRPSTLDRIRGSLLSQAIGDALGTPLEGLTSAQIEQHYGRVESFVDGSVAWSRRPFHWRLPGLYSDDTQQALAIAHLLLTTGKLDPQALSDLFLQLSQPRDQFYGAYRGVGRSFRRILDLMEEGIAHDQLAGTSAGISAAMRVAPIGLFYREDPQEMIAATLASAELTHRDVRSLIGATAVTLVLSRLLQGEQPSPAFLLRVAGDVQKIERDLHAQTRCKLLGTPRHLHSLSLAIAKLEALVDDPREQAFLGILEQANCVEECCRRVTQGYPLSLLPTCLYLLVVTESPREALIDAINLGGDTDTAGAILGSWVGAFYGVDALPDCWLQQLQNREGLEQVAQGLFDRGRSEVELPDLLAVERQLTETERAYTSQLTTNPRSGSRGGPSTRSQGRRF